MLTIDYVIEIMRHALTMTLSVTLPLLGLALVLGLIVGIFQAATSINEQTLSFVPKLFVVFAALLVLGPWILGNFQDFFNFIFGEMINITR